LHAPGQLFFVIFHRGASLKARVPTIHRFSKSATIEFCSLLRNRFVMTLPLAKIFVVVSTFGKPLEIISYVNRKRVGRLAKTK
jgi:hypothetical protein